MFPIVGSGKFITAPIITEDGQPIEDPLVLMQTNLNNNLVLSSQSTANAVNGKQSNENGISDTATSTPGTLNTAEEPIGPVTMDKREIQWKLTLHQIGMLCCLLLEYLLEYCYVTIRFSSNLNYCLEESIYWVFSIRLLSTYLCFFYNWFITCSYDVTIFFWRLLPPCC